MNQHLLFIIALICYSAAGAQETEQHLYLDAFATPDSLILRWATDSPSLYVAGKRNGYLLQKATANSTSFETIETVKPLSELAINQRLQQYPEDDAALVAAQIQLTDFDSLYAGGSDILDGYQQHNNRMLGLNFVNLSADLSAPAAEILGFRKVLYNYQAEEKAIYRIVCLDEQQQGIDTAYHYHNASLSWLPPVDELLFEQQGKRLQIKWDYLDFSSFYTAYDVYRSASPEGPYAKLNTRPIYTANHEAKFNFHFDTLALGSTFHYKVQGYSSFGVKGPFSQTFSHRMLDQSVDYTAINASAAGNHESIELSWEPQFKPADRSNLKGIRVFKSNQESGTYRALHPDFLPVNTRSFTDTLISDERMHFYRIVAYNQDEVEKSSSVIMADYVDTIAPAPPANLFGYIDSLGVARIIWQPNAERDLEGYRVYKSNRPDGTYYHTHDLLHRSNEFTDTVGLKFLTKQVYYKIAAVDFNNNHSGYSDLLILERPDTIPPAPPHIIEYQKTTEAVLLQLIPSSSTDVNATYVERSCYGKIDTFALRVGQTAFTDSLLGPLQGNIRYQIIAIDDSNNQSSSNTIEVIHHGNTNGIASLNIIEAEEGYQLNIQSQLTAGDVLYLYLEVGQQPLQFLDRLDHQTTEYPLFTPAEFPFRTAAYVINKEGKKSKVFFSNQITRS